MITASQLEEVWAHQRPIVQLRILFCAEVPCCLPQNLHQTWPSAPKVVCEDVGRAEYPATAEPSGCLNEIGLLGSFDQICRSGSEVFLGRATPMIAASSPLELIAERHSASLAQSHKMSGPSRSIVSEPSNPPTSEHAAHWPRQQRCALTGAKDGGLLLPTDPVSAGVMRPT